MSISRVYLCLIFLTFLTTPLVLCSRLPKTVAGSPAMEKGHIHSPALLVSESPKVDSSSSSSSMTKINEEPTTNSAISGFFRYKFPFQGWPFHKYAPFPMEKEHIHSPALPVSESPKVDSSSSSSSSSMTKINEEPTTNSAISGFFRYRFPFQGWPFHKYAPFPMVKPTNPSVPATPSTGAAAAAEEETEKVPSSPNNNGNRDGGNA